jgi:hypothetical protein
MWALIVNGTVAEVTSINPAGRFAPDMVWAAVPSGAMVMQGYSATETNGVWAFAEPSAPAAPTLAQQAAALIANGLTITSAGTPALGGVYTMQSGVPFGQEDIATEAQFISTYGEFTNGTTTNLEWPLLSGASVAFPTTAEFLAFAKAAGQFVAAVKLAVAQGGALPAATVQIS